MAKFELCDDVTKIIMIIIGDGIRKKQLYCGKLLTKFHKQGAKLKLRPCPILHWKWPKSCHKYYYWQLLANFYCWSVHSLEKVSKYKCTVSCSERETDLYFLVECRCIKGMAMRRFTDLFGYLFDQRRRSKSVKSDIQKCTCVI